MSKKDIRQAIIIDDNPFNSMVAQKVPPEEALGKALSEILSGMKLNRIDLSFYVVALETLAATLKNENEIKGSMISKIMYDYLSRTTTATSVSTVERSDSKT